MNKIISLLEDNNINIPRILLYNYSKLNLDEKSLLLLIYIINDDEKIFNPQKISEDLKYTLPEVLELIEKISNVDLISINTIKNNGIVEEVIDVSNLYKKLAYIVINDQEKDNNKDDKTNLYDLFEKEFGRTLSPIEYEYINGWLNDDFNEEIILCALKEAVFNGASNLRYIDAILYEWKKKGIKTKEDVENDKRKFKKASSKKTEMFDYDWLNDES